MSKESKPTWYARLWSRIFGHSLESSSPRPRFYDENAHPWHIEMVESDSDGERHPAWTSAVFTVHGIGTQPIAETAAVLRSGFDEALGLIREYQKKQPDLKLKWQPLADHNFPPPYVSDGWWANYEDVEETFKHTFNAFEPDQKKFFRSLWRHRTNDAAGTVFWFLRQQLGLLSLRTLWEVGPFAWLLYVGLQPVAFAILAWMYLRKRELITGFLADVRLYADPRGVTERAIVQRIDARVAEKFLRLIGLAPDFTSLTDDKCVKASDTPLRFQRVVWVAHSLGTVISYNVLSDLFERAEQLSESGTAEQQTNVKLFRKALRRFVTLGSPLDKFAFLFRGALRPWPRVGRSDLLDGGDWIPAGGTSSDTSKRRVWWINYFHVLDPVSGSLNTDLMRDADGGHPPVNVHIGGLFRVPGAAHMAYWKSADVLRFVLGRTYGKACLADRPLRPTPRVEFLFKAFIGSLVWAILIGVALLGLVRFVPQFLEGLGGYLGRLLGVG